MNIEKEAIIKKLLKYPKKDIVEAICQQYLPDYIINDVLEYLEEKSKQKVFAEYDKALKTEIEIQNAFIKWQYDMCEKYGDGETVKISVLPAEDIAYGAKLEKAVQEARKIKQKFNSKIDKFLKIEE